MFKNRFLFAIFIASIIFVCSSCSKKDESTKENNPGLVAIDDKDIHESDKDLKEVDYKDIYDKLSSKGQWVQVSGKDLGLKGSSSIEKDFQKTLLSIITGINEVYAETDADPGAFFVWKPADNLAVQLGVNTTAPPVYVPYVNGRWVNTDAGWYFQAPTPEEEIVDHYGRWVNTPSAGYVWVPGRVWAPAWVDWREQDNYIAWAPLPPSIYIVDDAVPPPPIDYGSYIVVEKKYFIEPDVYKYYYDFPDRVVIKDWNRPQGIVVVNNIIIDRGPDVNVIEKFYGKPMDVVKINHVKEFTDVKYSEKEFSVYTPGFKKGKFDKKTVTTISQPKSFAKYEDIKVKGRENENNQDKGKDKNFENPKESRDNKTPVDENLKKKLGDDRDMHKDLEQNNKDKGNKDNGNKDNGKDKGDKEKKEHDKK